MKLENEWVNFKWSQSLERMDAKVFCFVGRAQRMMRNGRERGWDIQRLFLFSELMRRRQLHL